MKNAVSKIFLLCLCLMFWPSQEAFSENYTYTELPYIGQGYWSNEGDAWVSDINDKGEVTGTTREINGQYLVRAFFWSEKKGLQLIENDPPGEGLTRGHCLNDLGQVVGYGISEPPSITTPFVWSEDTGTKYLRLLPNFSHGAAESINNRGQITGFVWENVSAFVIWNTLREEPTIIDSEPFEYISSSTKLSQNGKFIGTGYGYDESITSLSFIWTKKEGIQILNPPFFPGDIASGAIDVNEKGEIVGYSTQDWNTHRAVLWTKKGSIEELGCVGERTANFAYGINNSKEVVGVSFNYEEDPEFGLWIPGNARAFVWNKTMKIMDLNDLVVDLPEGVELLVAVAVNNMGQIAVEGLNHDTGETVFAVLTPLK